MLLVFVETTEETPLKLSVKVATELLKVRTEVERPWKSATETPPLPPAPTTVLIVLIKVVLRDTNAVHREEMRSFCTMSSDAISSTY